MQKKGPLNSKGVTINEVAKLSGVSKTTVSRYLNGRYDAIADETRERIKSVIEELNYRPNRIAQSLKARNSRIMGCLVSDIGSPFSSIIVKGINSVCIEYGYQLLLVDSGDDPERERKGIRDLLENQVDGLIINTTGKNDEYILSLKEQGVPIVLADRCLGAPGLIDTVATENYYSTYRCISYLFELGYEHVAFFTQGNGTVSPRILRFYGYCDAVKESFGKDAKPLQYQFDIDDSEDCPNKIKAFKNEFEGKRVAVFAVNGVSMLNVLQAVQELGIEVGPEFGVCGFDDWGWARLIPPGITTITQDSRMVGMTAANLLLKRIAGTGPKDPVYEEFKNKLEIRGSTTRQ